MPELPDILLYVSRLQERIVGHRLVNFRTFNPFVLRTVAPPAADFFGREVTGIERLGKRVVLTFEGSHFAVVHLMIAGRFAWQSPAPEPKRPTGKITLASWQFDSGQLTLVETSTKKRASIYLVEGRPNLEAMRRPGIDVLTSTTEAISQTLMAENRTLKRILTDPDRFDGIGNAYSDEILHRARLSPIKLTRSLSHEEVERLTEATRSALTYWIKKLAKDHPAFPKPNQITAFRPDFAVHGRFGLPCPVCASPVQRIVRGDHETNYCATCQTDGKLLADRSLSLLLKGDWPTTLEEMQAV